MEGWWGSFYFNHPLDDLRSNAQQYQLDLIYQKLDQYVGSYTIYEMESWQRIYYLNHPFDDHCPMHLFVKNLHASGGINAS